MTSRKFTELSPEWVRKPQNVAVTDDRIEIITESGTDLWQRTYYGFTNDNAPVFQAQTDEKYFSFIVRTQFESKDRFDQCGVAMYRAEKGTPLLSRAMQILLAFAVSKRINSLLAML